MTASFCCAFALAYRVFCEKGLARFFARPEKGQSIEKETPFYKWVSMMEKSMKRAGVKINVPAYIAVSAALAALAFAGSLSVFENVTASIMLASSVFIMPQHAFEIMRQKKEEKTKEQMVAAVRIFTAEFLQAPQIERGFKAVGERVADPVGEAFRNAHMELVVGREADAVLAKLSERLGGDYGQMFVQLLRLAKNDSSATELFADLLEKIESSIEMGRKNEANLAGEKMLAFIMACCPIPAYLMMARLVPETSYFLAKTAIGRIIVMASFGSMLIWALLDRITWEVD